ncbi:hypothetical protein RhiirC2_751396 [Rhizophagus irregularis]|uniref:Transposase domain-containing protein n=1 Tax=Rhizophagus irregularis TaxID=588596 RepID=A0A2N1N1D5_9GLOM|nr:hypothetical protein RhiirC2_751396 [Rhizophagus irregularis]
MPKVKSKKIENVPKEISDYPETDSILYTDRKRSYNYIVKQESLYPQPSILAYTQGKNKYKIPDRYCVETTWGRGKKKKTVKCFINYTEGKPLFKIMYGVNCSEEVQSNISSTTAANAVLRKLFPLNEKSLISGVHLFGIYLTTLKQARENVKSAKENNVRLIPLKYCSKPTLNKRQHKFGNQLKQHVQVEGTKIYGEDQVVLKQVSYSIRNMDFQIDYEKKNDINKKKLISVAQAIDLNYIPHEGYRALAAVEPNIQREWAVSEQRLKITTEMNQKIPITLINLPLDFAEYSNSESNEIIQTIKKGGTRSVKDILKYIVPVLISNKILDINNPIIHLRVSGDGRNVGRKIKHVMITIAILNDIQNIHKPNYHYTTVLFPDVEKYEVLEIMMASFIKELDEIKKNGLIISEMMWKFELYFSSDWKFLTICLGFNSANSKFFCPWCQISKCDQGNNWKISKKMENIHEYPDHNKKPLFYMIPLDKWVPDELHILLQFNQFDNTCRDEIVQEMNRIGVNFQFWQEKGANAWNHTSLMGDDKKKVLKKFNFKRILPLSRAKAVRELWDRFDQVYFNLKLKNFDPQQFQFEAEDWLELFKELYMPSDITPYIHVLVYHMSEFMEKHKQFGIKAFSCAPVEKKNHQQVTHFFRQTMKDGGKNKKLVITDILEYENRVLFYLFDNVEISTPKPKKISLK